MAPPQPVLTTDENKQLILSDLYFCRYMGCENVLRENNIPDKSVYQVRRVYNLILSSNDHQAPTAEEKTNFKRAISELEKFIQLYHKKELRLRSLKKKDLNEVFLDECYDYVNLTKEKVAKFIQLGVDINYKDEKTGLKPFHYASKSDFLDVNAEFLKNGANVNERFSKNESDTVWTRNHSCDYNKLKLYIEHGAKLNAKDSKGNSVLHHLVDQSNVESVKFLVEKGADVNIKNAQGQTPLFFAAKNGNNDNIEFFISKGCDINLVDKNGNTPLIMAASSNNTQTVELLIQKGADSSIKNSDGKTYKDLMSSEEPASLIDPQQAESLSSSRISSAIKPLKSESVTSNNLEPSRLQRLRELIVSKLRSGAKYVHYDENGSNLVQFENGVYVHKFTNKSGTIQRESVYGTDDQVLAYLCSSYKSGPKKAPQIDAHEYILNNLF